jgi:predicted RNase H-like nuclease (RuvC/YqgF family)
VTQSKISDSTKIKRESKAKIPSRGINIHVVQLTIYISRRFIMQANKASKRLESDIQSLKNIINSLVEENYMLKNMLNQTQPTTNQTNRQVT